MRTFTIGFQESAYNEAEYAKEVARHLGTNHTELYVTHQQAIDVITRLPALYDEPFSDPSQIPTSLVSQLTRQQVTVSLSGDAGDELFGGYNRYIWAKRIWGIAGPLPNGLCQLIARGMTTLSPAQWERLTRVVALFLPSASGVSLPEDKAYKLAEILLAVRNKKELYQCLNSFWKDPASVVY